jgi:hypothetical protein
MAALEGMGDAVGRVKDIRTIRREANAIAHVHPPAGNGETGGLA